MMVSVMLVASSTWLDHSEECPPKTTTLPTLPTLLTYFESSVLISMQSHRQPGGPCTHVSHLLSSRTACSYCDCRIKTDMFSSTMRAPIQVMNAIGAP